MSAETRLAFAHPEARAAATCDDQPLDRISVRDYTTEVEIGAFQQERGTTQQVRFNVVVEVAPVSEPLADDVDKILSYDRITEAIEAELAAERLNLLETLAERIADRVLLAPQAKRAFVRVEKLDRGPGALGVEIVRSHAAPLAPVDAAPEAPRVVFLSNDAIAEPGLIALLDQLEAGSAPLILCVGLPEGHHPQAAHGMPQRRIDLLAIEQNAWVLASQDDRCLVVGTRTELDWAMRHGQITVWAPSKLILDAAERPEIAARDGLGLALWFAHEMQAAELLTVGLPAPSDAAVPTHQIALPG